MWEMTTRVALIELTDIQTKRGKDAEIIIVSVFASVDRPVNRPRK
jgi:hypothetical protein